MHNTKEAFKDVTTKEELLKILKENSQYLTIYHQNEEIALRIMKAISNLDLEEERDILEYVHSVDKKMNDRNQSDFNKAKKIPIIIVGINCMLNHTDEIRGLSFDALMLLSRMLNFADDSLYDEMFHIYSSDVLEYIVARESNYNFQDYYAYVIEKMHERGKSSAEIIAYLDSQDNNAIIDEGYDYNEKMLEDLMFHEDRRI